MILNKFSWPKPRQWVPAVGAEAAAPTIEPVLPVPCLLAKVP
jgi:hypothetical protein